MYRNLGLKRVKVLYKTFGIGYLYISDRIKYTVYSFKLKFVDDYVTLIFGRKYIESFIPGCKYLKVSSQELYKIYQYINEHLIKEKVYDSRNNNQEKQTL